MAAAAKVADEDVQLVVGSDPEHASIVIAPLRLSSILLQRAQHDDVGVLRQAGAVPDETVHAIAEQERLTQNAGIQSCRTLRPVQEHMRCCRKVRMQGDAEQSAFRAVVDRKVEHSRLRIALHADHAAGLFLQHEHIVGADERE